MGKIYFKRTGLTAGLCRLIPFKNKLGIKLKASTPKTALPKNSFGSPAVLEAGKLPLFISENLAFTGKYVIHPPTGRFAVGRDTASHSDIAAMALGLDLAKRPQVIMGAINMNVLDTGKSLEFYIDSVTGFDLNLQQALILLKTILSDGGYGSKPEKSFFLPNGAKMIKLKAFKELEERD